MSWEDLSDARRKFFLRSTKSTEVPEPCEAIVRELVDCLGERVVATDRSRVFEVCVVQVNVDTGLLLVGVGRKSDYSAGRIPSCGAYVRELVAECDALDRSDGVRFDAVVEETVSRVARMVVRQFRERVSASVVEFVLSDVDGGDDLYLIEW
ncbi:MAG: hypothetical protein KDC95_23295 [Planctomycetes bacterium]|nr:hypothetical protein [Planctomycetota bacterium]MCA9614017.1 hypothetical protein [Myxococcales bacterium]